MDGLDRHLEESSHLSVEYLKGDYTKERVLLKSQVLNPQDEGR